MKIISGMYYRKVRLALHELTKISSLFYETRENVFLKNIIYSIGTKFNKIFKLFLIYLILEMLWILVLNLEGLKI